MKIHCISDTHNEYDKLNTLRCDLLLHAGDATNRGRLEEIMRFLDWYAKQDARYKVFVPGNHDWGFQHNEPLFREECEKRGIILLINQAVEIEGIKIYGAPQQPWFYDWAFNVQRGPEIKKFWDAIPDDTELLITHGPPAKILDWIPRSQERVGCEDLWNRIVELKNLKMHLFGHIHASRGTLKFMDKLFVNAATVDDRHYVMSEYPWIIERDVNGNYEVAGEHYTTSED